MSKQHQRPDELSREIKNALTAEDKALLGSAGALSSATSCACAGPLCDVLLKYCSYRPPFSTAKVNPFDDPFVGAALITADGHILGAHRKENQNEPHAEVETLLGALDTVSSDVSKALASDIRDGLQRKIWFNSTAAEKDFINLFKRAGQMVRDYCFAQFGTTTLILISTLEPCREFESQPSCSRLISAFTPDAVIYGCDDTNAKGQGRPILIEHGINLFTNVSYELNVEINLLFYAAVHYLNLLHTAALESQSRFEISYVIASLHRLRPRLVIGEDTRLRINFDDPVALPVHRAPIELRAPPTEDPFPKTADEDRVLFINAVARDFLSLYLHRHNSATNRIPGVIICSQGPANEEPEDQQAKTAVFLAKLRDAGVRIYTNVLRKADEKFLALQSILRLDQQVSAEGKLCVFVKEDQDRYSNKPGTAETIAKYLQSLQTPRRVTIYYARDAVRSLMAMIATLKANRAFQAGSPLSRSSFQTFVVTHNEDEANNTKSQLSNWLHEEGLSQRFFVWHETQKAAEHHSTAILRELIARRLDPIAQDTWWLKGLLKDANWKERQAAGLFLSGAAKQDPLLYQELITSKLPTGFDVDYWQETTSILNAVAKYGRPTDVKDCEAVVLALLALSAGLEEALLDQLPSQLLDVVWRYTAAALSVAETAEEVQRFFQGSGLRAYIGRSSFLLKEFFFYADRVPVGGQQVMEFAFDTLQMHFGTLSQENLSQVALRVTRLSTLWRDELADNARHRLASILAAFPEVNALCAAELKRCRFVSDHRLAGVFKAKSDKARLFCSYLFLRTAGSRAPEQGLFAAVGREVDQAVSKPQQGKVPVSWRGDRTSFARLVLSEVPTEQALSYLSGMAEDEDDSIKWAAIVLVMDYEFRWKLLGPEPGKSACLNVRSEIAAVLSKTLAGEAHYWVKREFVSVFSADHSPADRIGRSQSLPLMARLQVGDVAGTRAFLCGDGSGEHPEVIEVLKRLRKRMKRIVLVLPPIEIDAGSAEQAANRSTTPPLGLGSIASFLLSHGHDVELLDCHRFPELTNELPALVRGRDVVGFNVVTSSFRSTEARVAEIRKALPTAAPKVVLGGHAVTLHPNEFLQHRRFAWDYLILGDGELPLLKLVQTLDDPEWTHIDGVIRRPEESTPILMSSSLSAAEWDDLPWIDHSIYRSPLGESYEPSLSRTGKSREAHIVMSRGCAWHCSFCTEAILRGKAGEVRRSPKDALDEITYLVKKDSIDRVQFIDDNLLPQIAARGASVEASLSWAETLLSGLQKLCIQNRGFGWRGIFRFEDFIKYEELIPNWLERLQSSGCLLLAFGVEHGSEERRKKLKGGSVSNDEIVKIVRNLTEHRIATKGYFIVGGEGENQESTSHSIELAISAGFTLAYFALFKNFRELIRRSNGPPGSVENREKTFMCFKNLLADFDERIAKLATPEDCLESFGMSYDGERIASAKTSIKLLSESGFRFQDLFKYNDFHDNLDEVNDSVSVWKESGDRGLAGSFLQAVRRAYFEFYARPEFVTQYRWLIERGY